MITGTCLCGVVRYELDTPVHDSTHCHCSLCRKHHGAPFASFVAVSEHALRWVAGQERVRRFASSASRERCFCEVCGSVAPARVGDVYWVPAGNLVGELGDAGGRHMFVASKPAWHTIADALPQYPAAAPGWTCEVDAPAVTVLQGATAGACLCGEVRFAVSGQPSRWLQCHCSRCRRARSAAHGSNAFYPLPQFTWHTGRDQVRSYSPPDAQRFAASFCTCCGGGAPVERPNVPFVLVPAGLLDTDPAARPQAHIHVASKATWFTIQDTLPKFAELPT